MIKCSCTLAWRRTGGLSVIKGVFWPMFSTRRTRLSMPLTHWRQWELVCKMADMFAYRKHQKPLSWPRIALEWRKPAKRASQWQSTIILFIVLPKYPKHITYAHIWHCSFHPNSFPKEQHRGYLLMSTFIPCDNIQGTTQSKVPWPDCKQEREGLLCFHDIRVASAANYMVLMYENAIEPLQFLIVPARCCSEILSS